MGPLRHGFFVCVLATIAVACASRPPLPKCELDVTGLEEFRGEGEGIDAAYRVRGDAGGEGKVWLAAKTAEGSWISGDALEVGPGVFAAIVDLRLTARPASLKAVLEVDGRRCADDAALPAS